MFWLKKTSAGAGERPVRFGVRRLHDWPARNSNFPEVICAHYNRIRSVLPFDVTFSALGALPPKSTST